MKKETFVKSTIILMIGGFLTKILGMIIKIVMSRLMGSEGIGLYMLVLPTFSLFIGLGQFGLPIALSKMVAEDKKNNRNLMSSLIDTYLIINFFLIIFLIIFAPFLANKLLQEELNKLNEERERLQTAINNTFLHKVKRKIKKIIK